MVALLALLSAAGCGAPSGAVVLGLSAPLSEDWGNSVRMGAELAQKQINSAGGIGGRPLEIRAEDDGGESKRAIAIAQELFDDPRVVAVVGHATSGAMSAAAPVYELGLPAVSPTATSPDVSRLGTWIFRVASSDSANAVGLARVAQSVSHGNIAILYENDDYGRGLSESFRSALAGSTGRSVRADPYLPGTEDFDPYLRRLQRAGTDLIFIAGLEQGATRIIQQARAIGMDARFLGGDGLEGLVAMGPVHEGTLVGLLFHPDASPAARAFAEAYRAEYGREADSFAALAYDAVRLISRGMTEGNHDRASIRRYLAGVGRDGGAAPFEGVTGTVRFDENGDPVGKAFAVGNIRDGKIELAAEGR